MRAVHAVVASAALALLVGCGSGSSPEAPKLLTRAEADARTVVPFTRGVRLDKAGRIVDVTFDAAEPEQSATPTLIIGLRSEGREPAEAHAVTAAIERDGLKARVVLERLDTPSPEPVPLWKVSDDGRSQVKLATDIVGERLWGADVAVSTLAEAGLYSQQLSYRELQWASAGLGERGRYRLRIDLLEDRPDLEGLQIDVMVGYEQRGK
ncbi:hypothetical protein C1922_02365 [Stenotrophomonas sp. ZAC14D2_NAIMI4_7]|uniref:hypothetical protein n=1 Tax=Stenotrophomonas sp. ZAC14D2_NAIMI4_7 TaxID=2072405 RepID=UPI000D541E55|nr:hypothetical protein [Stenotrophomonas sp. ZAC14D2_NAIMI4_7]AWH16251.1 hypothetical protein C1922_02365 [Stenotrophomonas sp. ZAC14D2_NAIMI4_7]